MTDKSNSLENYFDNCLYFSISRLQRDINKLASQAFKESGLAPSHAFLLMALYEKSPSTAGELSEVMGLAPSTITRFIDKLEKQKLCSRTQDGRISYTSITQTGQALIPTIEAGWKKLFETYNALYGEAEADKLNKMITSLNHSQNT